jgi:DNA end-binding protein Ku
MASRSTWKGTIQFGMVVMPVKLFNGISDDDDDTRMVNLHDACNTRMKQPKYCPKCETFVEIANVVKGVEIGKDQYLRLEAADLAKLPMPSTSSISIDRFVRQGLEDPRWFRGTYYLMPDKVGNKAFTLFAKAMELEGVTGIAKIAFRANSHEQLCAVRPRGNLFMLQAMRWPGELRDTAEFEVTGEVGEKELNMGTMLVRSMTEDTIDLTTYTDTYADAFKRLVEAKLAGEDLSTLAPAPKVETDDLMDALTKSLAAVGAK